MKVEVLAFHLGFTYCRILNCATECQLFLVKDFISCTMKTNAVLISFILKGKIPTLKTFSETKTEIMC